MRVCKVCSKEFIPSKNNHMQILCGAECSVVNKKRIKREYYDRVVVPSLPGPRVKKTPEEVEAKRKAYSARDDVRELRRERRKIEENRVRERASGSRYKKRNPDVGKNGHLKRKFGITLDDYNTMMDKQFGLCMICKQKEIRVFKKTNKVIDLCVDHCHTTGKVRGLLCWNCNTSLGKFKDSIEFLQNAIDYLLKSREDS